MKEKNRVTINPMELWKELGGVSRYAICIAIILAINSVVVYATRGITLRDIYGEVISPVGQVVLRHCFTLLIELGIALITVVLFLIVADVKSAYNSAVSKKAYFIMKSAIEQTLTSEETCSRLKLKFQKYEVRGIYKEYISAYGEDSVMYKIQFDDIKGLLDAGLIRQMWND